MVLADTSIWVDYLRSGSGGGAAELDRLLVEGEVVVCGPIIAELVAGVREKDRQKLEHSLLALPWVELDRATWLDVGHTARRLHSQGAAVALTDIEIAHAAVKAGAQLWSKDRDFDRIASVLKGLELMGAEGR